ncbi:MAG: glycosyltransferase family 2 protein [Tannerella sp.]|jgi:GT2 family glycosyltransferase|nr:glycosyltransferase family 2 protein [Tannerella sp.]
MKLSIVIVNYNVKYYLLQCLDSVTRATRLIASEIFVVDNCSADRSVEYLKPLFPNVHFIENRENAGFSKANNQAIETACGEYVLLLNPDTVVGEDTLIRVCDFMDAHPGAGALGVKMIDGYGRFLPESKRGFPSPWNAFCKMTGLSALFPLSKTFGGYHIRYLDENKPHKVDILSGAFMLIRRQALDKSGLLDETFFMYGEDIDLSYRIGQAGFDIYYLPETIIHYKGESTRKDLRYVKIFHEAMLIFFRKHYPHSNTLFKWMIRFAVIMAATLSALRKLLRRPGYSSECNYGKVFTFNADDISYAQMIRAMDENKLKDTLYQIYHPQKQIIITPGEIIYPAAQ